jgi:hypothetical protein
MVVDLFSTPERLGHLWLEKSEPGKGFTLGPAALRKIRKLLAPIGALQLLADDVAIPVSEQLKQKIVAVQSVVDISERFLGDDPLFEHSPLWSDRERGAAEDILKRFTERLEHCHRRAVEAEKILKKAGGEFDPKTRTVKFQGPKGRPWLLLNRCIVEIFVEMKTRKDSGISRMPEVRKDIACILGRYFPSEHLDPGPRGNIAKAIEKYLQGVK